MNQEAKFRHKLEQERETFYASLDDLVQEFKQLIKLSDYANSKENNEKFLVLKDKIQQCHSTVETFNHRDTLFDQPKQEYVELLDFDDQFQPYQKLWSSIVQFEFEEFEWNEGQFIKLDHKYIEATLMEYQKLNKQ